MSASLTQAIDDLRTMRESYDSLIESSVALSPDVAQGKTALATAITGKGVTTSATDSLATMADKVALISQGTYEIDGGEMYAKQLFGSLETPNYWNLYEVLEQLLSDGRLVNYGGILLAEYYKGYDSLALSGAGAGGAYVVSDKDSQGNFIMYTSDTTHVWDTAFDGKGNRWVAYCFAGAGHDFTIADTNTSPRSIHIGRHVGTITSLVNGRISQIVVTDGNELDSFNTASYTQNFNKVAVFRNLSNQNGCLLYQGSCESLYIQGGVLKGSLCTSVTTLSSLTVDADEITAARFQINGGKIGNAIIKAETIDAYNTLSSRPLFDIYNASGVGIVELDIITEKATCSTGTTIQASQVTKKIYFGYITNDKTKSVDFSMNVVPSTLTDIELQEGWCKPINIVYGSRDALANVNEETIYAHILQKLKQDEADCGDGITITLGSTNLAKLTSAESVALLDSLTNTYGYTFA